MKLRTKLTMAECQARLGSATDLRGMAVSWDAETAGAVLGEFRGPAFRLHTGKYYSNAFAPFFYGKLAQAEGGTVVEGEFRLNPLVRLFSFFSFSFVIVFGVGATIVPAATRERASAGRGWFFAGLIAMAALSVGFAAAGQWLGRGDQAVIHAFLKTRLEADDI